MRSPGFFALAERINKCLMIANDTKFNPVPRSVRPTCRKILPALFLKNAEGALHIPLSECGATAEIGHAFRTN